MKKITLLFLLILSQSTFGQVEFTETKKLAATCKVWGLLKYYHPKVASGVYHWDKQLFDVLPKIEQAKTKEAFSLVLEDWINSLGEVEAIAPIMLSEDIDYFEKNFDLSWIDKNDLFSNNLSRALKFIENNRFQGNQNYVHQKKAGNIFVKNEDYSAYDFNDKNSRLLALFMYWNLMEYFYPYKYVMDKDWDSTLEDMIPLFIEAKNDDDFYLAMQKLTVRLNDSHVVFHRYLGKGTKTKRFLPVTCKIIDEKMIVTEVLQAALTEKEDIKVGDVITKVNGKSIKEIILEHRDFISASNEAYYLEHILEPVLSGYSETITLEFLKEGMTTSKTIDWNDYNIWQRWELNQASKLKKDKFKRLENNIGYVNMGALQVENVPEMIKELKSSKAIIFDMRNYPNGTFKVISQFLNVKQKPFAIYTKPDLKYPGKFKWTKSERPVDSLTNNNNYKGKVVVLLNEKSKSQSEWTAMCFQTAEDITIIGSQTAGTDGNVSDFDFIKAFYSRFTGIGVYYPDKRETQRIGIVPDIEVKPTILGIQQGKDEVLDRALEFIETGK